MNKIAEKLTKNSIPTKRNGRWHQNTVSKILKNPVYCGYLRWERYLNKNGHDSIIEVFVFNKVQSILNPDGVIPT